MKIFFIKLNFYNIHIKFKKLPKKSSLAFCIFDEASPIPSTHFWKDFTSSQKKVESVECLEKVQGTSRKGQEKLKITKGMARGLR